jgi:uncharacterized membrane protein HdeD (DUF308 family)
MPRPQDVLFAILAVIVLAMLAFGLHVAVLALAGAFACGSIPLLAGMLPDRHESFWHRAFISVFLSVVMSSLVLILPGTLGPQMRRPGVANVVIGIAVLLPVIAFCFEILRTPRVIQAILRCFGHFKRWP